MSGGRGDAGGPDEAGFLRRWSARKRAGERPSPDPEAAPVADAVVPETVPVEEGVGESAVGADDAAPDDAPFPTDADMPPIESLDAGSDLSAFFSDGVSAALRRAALRHVFALPRYNVRDGLNDYDGDYTVFEPLGDTVTSDMKFHAARRERERLERERLAAEAAERDAEEPRVRSESADDEATGNEAADSDLLGDEVQVAGEEDTGCTDPDARGDAPVGVRANDASEAEVDSTELPVSVPASDPGGERGAGRHG